jgi:ATP-dependent RNA helicase RhlE
LMSPSEEWLLEAVEKVLDTRLLQQWYPGYEPDLTKTEKPARKGGQKQRDRKKALGQSARSKKRTSTESKYGRR